MSDEVKGPITEAEELEAVEIVSPELDELKKNTDAILDAVKELTKIVGEMKTESTKWRSAGRFIIPLIAIGYAYAVMQMV